MYRAPQRGDARHVKICQPLLPSVSSAFQPPKVVKMSGRPSVDAEHAPCTVVNFPCKLPRGCRCTPLRPQRGGIGHPPIRPKGGHSLPPPLGGASAMVRERLRDCTSASTRRTMIQLTHLVAEPSLRTTHMHHDLTTRGRTAPTPKETEEHVLTEDGTIVATIRAKG